MKKLKLKVGDLVWHDGDSGFCSRSKRKIVKVDNVFNRKTGDPEKEYVIESGQKFNEYGGSITSPFAYYITKI